MSGITLDEEPKLYRSLEDYSPGHTASHVEALAGNRAWGYLEASDRKLLCFHAALSDDGRWTVSPLYTHPREAQPKL